MLEEVKQKILAGEVNLLMIGFAGPDNACLHGTAWKDDTLVPWARSVAIVASMHDHLMKNGLKAG
jgi:hypothetical protein